LDSIEESSSFNKRWEKQRAAKQEDEDEDEDEEE
jgi:hypothetical protein